MESILHLSSSPSSLNTGQDGRPTHDASRTNNAQIGQQHKAMNSGPESSDEEDVHQCGRCKRVFHSLNEYVAHKASKVCRVVVTGRTDTHHQVEDTTTDKGVKNVPITSSQNILAAAAKDTILNHLQTISVNDDRQSTPRMSSDAYNNITKHQSAVSNDVARSSDGGQVLGYATGSSCLFDGSTTAQPPAHVKQGKGRPRKSASAAAKATVPDSDISTAAESISKMVMRERIRPRPIGGQFGDEDVADNSDHAMPTEEGAGEEDIGGEPKPKKGKRGRPKKKTPGLKCAVCSLVYPTKESLSEHKKKHSKHYKCKVCNKYFFTESKRDRHMEKETHHYECDLCHRILVSKTSLQRHKAVHSDRVHVCATCNRAFKTQRDMRSHELCVHSNQRDHVCDVCGKGFPKAEKLSRHKLIHSPNRPVFPCPFKNHVGCEKVFFRKDKLTRHLYSHSKIKPFKCELCDKAFARTDNLREHLRTHTGVFRYYCPLCGKGQTGPKKFVQHMQKQHNIADPEIPPAMEDSVPDTLVEQHKAIVHAESTARAVKAAENAIRRETVKKSKAFKDSMGSPPQGTHVISVSASGMGTGIPSLQSAVSSALSMPQLTLSHGQPADAESMGHGSQQQTTGMESADDMIPISIQNPGHQSAVSGAAPDSRVTVQLLSQGVQPTQTMPHTISTHHFTTLLNSDLASIGEAVVRNSNLVTALFKNFPNS